MLNPNESCKLSWVSNSGSVDLDVLALRLVGCRNALVHVGQRLADQHLRSTRCHSAKPDLELLNAFLVVLWNSFGHAAVDGTPQKEIKGPQGWILGLSVLAQSH